jgi:hypothetical protein
MTQQLQNALQALFFVLTALAAQTSTYTVQPLNAPATPQNLPAIMVRVAACESTGNPNGTPRQFNSDGSPLWGNDPITGKPIMRDVGYFQINTYAHAEELKALGLDVVHSEADNIAYAMILYKRNGLKDWTASENCWRVTNETN